MSRVVIGPGYAPIRVRPDERVEVLVRPDTQTCEIRYTPIWPDGTYGQTIVKLVSQLRMKQSRMDVYEQINGAIEEIRNELEREARARQDAFDWKKLMDVFESGALIAGPPSKKKAARKPQPKPRAPEVQQPARRRYDWNAE